MHGGFCDPIHVYQPGMFSVPLNPGLQHGKVQRFTAEDDVMQGETVKTVQLGKRTVNWKQRTPRFLHLVLAIENTSVFNLCSVQLANGAQMEHTKSFSICYGAAIRLGKARMHRALSSVILFCFAAGAGVRGATLRIPAAREPVTVDGVVDEEIWKKAAVLPTHSADFGAFLPAGGEMRAVVRGGYLCLSARLPETTRVVARSTGLNPVWWREDLVIWSLHFKSFST